MFGYNSWEDYHKRGIIPNLWKGITGQLSAEVQTDAAIQSSQKQYEQELQWQREKYATDMDFANRQLQAQTDIANKNFGLQQEQFQYQKDLNELQMQREDNAMQRQVADLKAAGFSPLAAIGGSGSAAGSLNAGTAPQYDGTGIGAAAGQYLDLARQYASLHADLSSKNNDAKLGARMALAQMQADLHFKGQNMATQYFNAAVNARNKNLQNQALQEDITTKKYQNDWYKEHGYSQVTLATVLSDFLNNSNVKNAEQKIFDFVGGNLDTASEKLTDVVQNVGNASKEVKEFITSDEKRYDTGKAIADKIGSAANQKVYNSLPEDQQKYIKNWCLGHKTDVDDLLAADWFKIVADYRRYKKNSR